MRVRDGGRRAQAEGGPHRGDVLERGRLVAREGELRLVELPEVDTLLVARLQHLGVGLGLGLGLGLGFGFGLGVGVGLA